VEEPRGNEIVLDAVRRIRTLAQFPRAVEIVITDMHIEVGWAAGDLWMGYAWAQA